MTPGILDQVTTEFMQAFKQDALFLQQAALSIFYYLSIIQLTLTSLWLSLTGESLHKSFTELLKTIIYLSIFYALIEFGALWLPEIINGFIELGTSAHNNLELSPSAIATHGLTLASAIMNTFEGLGILKHPFIAIMGAISCLAIIVIYALIAAELTILIIKSYVLTATSSLFFACGATASSRSLAINFMRAVIALGIKLMMTYLILAAGESLNAKWLSLTLNAQQEYSALDMLVMLSAIIIYFCLFKTIPSFVAGFAAANNTHYTNVAAASVHHTKSFVSNTAQKFSTIQKVAPPNFRSKT